jgi:hypothetical protein
MELSEATLELLQDEAYAFLCREVVKERLVSLEREKDVIASTRPPFGLLARKETRDTFTRSMRTALDSEETLREWLPQISEIEHLLKPLLRRDIAAYLTAVSPDYRRYQQVRDRLDVWERVFQALLEFVVAFARELSILQEAVAADSPGGRSIVEELPVVREAAVRLENKRRDLLGTTVTVTDLAQAGAMSEICVPVLPDLQPVAWVSRLAVLQRDQALNEATCFEKEVRDFLADGVDQVRARLKASREECTRLESKFLEQYWTRLRAHAQTHYVEERDVDEVLDMLTQRYARVESVPEEEETVLDPYAGER